MKWNLIGFAVGLSFLALGYLSETFPVLKIVAFAWGILVFGSLGVIAVFFPRRFREYARAQRPKNWERIFGLSVFWAIIDEPIYLPMVVGWGLLVLGMMLWVVWLVLRPFFT